MDTSHQFDKASPRPDPIASTVVGFGAVRLTPRPRTANEAAQASDRRDSSTRRLPVAGPSGSRRARHTDSRRRAPTSRPHQPEHGTAHVGAQRR